MSKYTTEIRYICESLSGYTNSQGFDNVDDIINAAAPLFFNFTYPWHDEQTRAEWQKKFLLNYYTREIGFETLGLFKIHLAGRLRKLMPYYNALYDSALLQFNPFNDVDYTRSVDEDINKTDSKTVTADETTHAENENHTTGAESSENTNEGYSINAQTVAGERKNKYSDTPQGTLTDVDNDTYLTNYTAETINDGTKRLDASTTTTNENNNQTDQTGQNDTTTNKNQQETGAETNNRNLSENVSGKMSTDSYSKRLIEYRETIMNIDAMLIDEFDDMFIKLW